MRLNEGLSGGGTIRRRDYPGAGLSGGGRGARVLPLELFLLDGLNMGSARGPGPLPVARLRLSRREPPRLYGRGFCPLRAVGVA